jgi:hypothetical protein
VKIADMDLVAPPGWEPRTYAEDQPEYLPLPTLVSMDAAGRVVSRWQPTAEERQRIAEGADVYVTVMTFHGPLQPQLVTVGGAPLAPIPESERIEAKP